MSKKYSKAQHDATDYKSTQKEQDDTLQGAASKSSTSKSASKQQASDCTDCKDCR